MTKQLKIILIVIACTVAVIFGIIIHRMFFMFDWKEIQVYINEEAEKYSNPAAAADWIKQGVEATLESHNKTQQVLSVARHSKLDKEQVLVTAAINQCISNGYLPGLTNK